MSREKQNAQNGALQIIKILLLLRCATSNGGIWQLDFGYSSVPSHNMEFLSQFKPIGVY